MSTESNFKRNLESFKENARIAREGALKDAVARAGYKTMREANELMDRFKEEVADAKPFAFPNESEMQAEMHWGYLQGVLHAHSLPSSLIEICGHHYKTAFIHGWKHGQEAMNEKV